jgi:nucleoside-diphosphate-sugar epimerase
LNNSVLVTGGKGFLGSHLVSHLSKNGYAVRVFASHRKQDNKIDDTTDDVIYGDIRDFESVKKAVKGVDRIIHLVSNFRRGGSDKNEAYAINVEGTENVLNAALKYNIKHLIHCSTIGVHGSVKEIPANEETPFNPGDLYQETKLIAEKKVWEFYRKNRLPITVVRPISMFGPGDMRMLKLFRMIKKGRFIIVGDGQPFFQPAYIDDVVQGFMKCLENEKAVGEAFIIGGDEYLTLNELCRMIANELNVTPPRIKIPLAPVLWLASICEVICSPLNIEPPLHRRRVSFFQNNRAFSVEKAKNLIDFHPQVSLLEGIRKTIQWYESQGLL